MEQIYIRINALFINGIIEAITSTVIVSVLLIISFWITNKFIKKRWPKSILVSKRIQKGLFTFIVILVFFMQIRSMSSVLTALLASGGLFAVIIGLASQEAASNMINGMMIIAYHPYSVGDLISLPEETVRGKVITITLRHTIIETLEKTQIIIPNSIMNKTMIENVSNIVDSKANYLMMDISYESNIEKAISIIQEIASKHPLAIDTRLPEDVQEGKPQIEVLCMDLKDSSILLRATIFTVDNATGFTLLSDLRIQVKEEFDKQGIVIPYPQLVVENKSSS